MAYNTHLTLQVRIIIETGIENDSTKAPIALTIGKEIKAHRYLVHNCSYIPNCANMKKRPHHRMCDNHKDSVLLNATLERSPGACNG